MSSWRGGGASQDDDGQNGRGEFSGREAYPEAGGAEVAEGEQQRCSDGRDGSRREPVRVPGLPGGLQPRGHQWCYPGEWKAEGQHP